MPTTYEPPDIAVTVGQIDVDSARKVTSPLAGYSPSTMLPSDEKELRVTY